MKYRRLLLEVCGLSHPPHISKQFNAWTCIWCCIHLTPAVVMRCSVGRPSSATRPRWCSCSPVLGLCISYLLLFLESSSELYSVLAFLLTPPSLPPSAACCVPCMHALIRGRINRNAIRRDSTRCTASTSPAFPTRRTKRSSAAYLRGSSRLSGECEISYILYPFAYRT